MSVLRIATRSSALAMWQAEHVRDLLLTVDHDLRIELVPTSTEGDRRTDIPLSTIGGKGVFATEVQRTLLEGRADVAVHSAKDLTSTSPGGLTIGAVPERGDPRDALVGSTLADLRTGATVATGSARRRALLAEARPDLHFAELRGNMATRLAKAGDFDAIVVAAVALERLGLSDHISEYLDPEVFTPQVAQAALAVEVRDDDAVVLELLSQIDHAESRRRVEAERAFLAELGGDCSIPAGAHATIGDDGVLHMAGVLAELDDSPRDRMSSIDAVEPASVYVRVVRARRSSDQGSDPGAELAAQLREELSQAP